MALSGAGGAVNRGGVVRCGLAALLFGASAPLASRLADDLSAFTLAGLLYVGAALAVAPLVRRRPLRRAARERGGGRLAVAVIAGGAVAPVLLVAGLARTPAATASLLLNLELVATVGLAALVFREHVGARIVAGTALVVAGGLVLGWSGSPTLRLGALLIVGACVCWGLDNCVTANLDEFAPEHVTLAKGAIAGTANLAIGLSLAPFPAATEIAAALAIGAVGYGASITLWVAGARDLGAARGQLVFATAPFFGGLVAWTLLGEPVLVSQLAALALAAVGATCVLGSGHTHEHPHAAVEHEHAHAHDDVHHAHLHEAGVTGPHGHRHRHVPVVHAHAHVPDLHHRHDH